MAEETSGFDEYEIQMIALERKFDELFNFVQLMVRWDLETEDWRKEDNKNTNDEVPEGHPHDNIVPPLRLPTPPRPPTPPKPEEKDSQISSKIDSLEEKIRLM